MLLLCQDFYFLIFLQSYRWYKRRRCYPTKKRWLYYLLPGILITTAGLVIFAFFETESNYQYVHSVWHTCMAFGVMLLLPSRTRKNVIHDSNMSELIDVNALNSELVENEILDYWSTVRPETFARLFLFLFFVCLYEVFIYLYLAIWRDSLFLWHETWTCTISLRGYCTPN